MANTEKQEITQQPVGVRVTDQTGDRTASETWRYGSVSHDPGGWSGHKARKSQPSYPFQGQDVSAVDAVS